MDYRYITEQRPHNCETDQGPKPFVTNILGAARKNNLFRTAIWTGTHLQMTLMCIPPRGEIGSEIHPDTDQIIRVEEGRGLVCMDACRDMSAISCRVCQGDVVFVPCGTRHNVINLGNCPLKLTSVYGPPQHPRGTVHRTKKEAEESEKQSGNP